MVEGAECKSMQPNHYESAELSSSKDAEAIEDVEKKDITSQDVEAQEGEDDTCLTAQDGEEEENEKDIVGSGDGTQEVSRPLPSEGNLAEADHTAHEEMQANVTVKEAEDDNISVTIQAEDAITLDFDGDDLLETGKNVKITDSEASEPKDGQDIIAQSPEKETKYYEMNVNLKNGKKEDFVKGDPVEKEARESSKQAESGDKEKDTLKKGPSSIGACGQAKSSLKESKDSKTSSKNDKGSTSSTSGSSGSSTKNIWVSRLSSNTKAADLKNLFGKYAKVLSAKVVTNARSPGAKCYGIVTMSSSTEVSRCIAHLHRTELHGQLISVEKMPDSAMALTTLTDRTDLMTLITGRGADFLTAQPYSLPLLIGGNALLVRVKGKKHGQLQEETIPALRDTPNISVIQEEMSRLLHETNLDTDRRDVRGEQEERKAVIMQDRPDMVPPRHPREAPTLPDPPPGRAKGACLLTSGTQELKGRSALAGTWQDTVRGAPPGSQSNASEYGSPESDRGVTSDRAVEPSTTQKNDTWLITMDGTQVDQGKSGMVHLLKGLLHDPRRMGYGRAGAGMMSQRSSNASPVNRIVQIEGSSMPEVALDLGLISVDLHGDFENELSAVVSR
ncbi:SAFB-like transcription modulator [Heterocephalus glaber]|uniref:SAFB-like transcription modulator n=1 Tax=Heterocephalus glaber TaxID=10181 RepID=G5C4V6_HETGA|nr:SAFB-like transcription modulator [Heterocephalus glaber]